MSTPPRDERRSERPSRALAAHPSAARAWASWARARALAAGLATLAAALACRTGPPAATAPASPDSAAKARSPGPPPQPAAPASRPAAMGPEPLGSGAVSPPELPDDPATALARRVFLRAGGDHLDQVGELAFSFVVERAGVRKMAADHRWDLRGGRDRVRWTRKDGVRADATVDLANRTGQGTLDGRPAEGEALAHLLSDAHARWVNDAYWLVVPLKLLDAGVHRSLDLPRTRAGKKYEILRLTFDQVGLTPGDIYWLFIDPETAQIERWEMLLQGESPPPEAATFEDLRDVGPLRLALDHRGDDGKVRVFFEGVRASAQVNEADLAQPPTATPSKRPTP